MTAPERVLSERALNRALLERQCLLDRVDDPVPRVLERMAGLQAQYAPSMYVGLWARVRGLERDAVTRLLSERAVVQGTLTRATIHLVSREDYWPISIAVREERRRWFLRAFRNEPPAEAMEAAAATLARALEDGPLRTRQIDELIGVPARRGIGLWLDLVRVPPYGTWENRRADLFGLASQWLGPEPEIAVADAVDLLVRRYLGGFGPSSRAEIVDFTGLRASVIAESVARLELVAHRAEDGTELLDLPGAPLPDEATPAPVRLLPTFEALLMTHVRRTGVLPEHYRALVYPTRNGQPVPVFLVDGVVAGSWRYESGRVELTEFAPLPRRVRAELDAEAERLAAFHA